MLLIFSISSSFAQIIYQESFEAGDGGWAIATGRPFANSTWALGEPVGSVIDAASEGVRAWVTNINGAYNDNELSAVLSPEIDFSRAQEPVLSLDVLWESEAFLDGAFMDYSLDGGSTWIPILEESFYNLIVFLDPFGAQSRPAWTGSLVDGLGTGDYETVSLDLDFLVGQPSVRFRVVFRSNAPILGINTLEGVAFDNIIIRDEAAHVPPLITGLENITHANSADLCSASVTIPVPSVSNAVGQIEITNNFNNTENASGVYPVGATLVTFTVTDQGTGLSSDTTITVTVQDEEAPVFTFCPTNLQVTAPPSANSALVGYSLPAFSDNCPNTALTRTAGNASGTIFPLGTTPVTHRVTDASGNTAECTFTVTVLPGEPADTIQVTQLVLFNADTDQVIGPLNDGDVVNLFETGSNLTVVALTNPAVVGSVAFHLNGIQIQMEQIAPYALNGNVDDDYLAEPLLSKPGIITLKAIPFTHLSRLGNAGIPLEITFEVVNGAAIDLVLLDAQNDVLLQTVNEGDVIDISGFPSGQLSMLAFTNTTHLSQVEFRLNGRLIQKENLFPYALGGNKDNDYFPEPLLVPGTFHIKVTPILTINGVDIIGNSLERNFELIATPLAQANQAPKWPSPLAMQVYPNVSQDEVQLSAQLASNPNAPRSTDYFQ
ncbi:MAG: HYR domain-containing protein [Bacteroidia bacterium]|nr:HYR domain-containing protein [Bacteroidia bacterium]